MGDPFLGLVELSMVDPAAYRREVDRLRVEEPARLIDFAEWFRVRLEKESIPRRRESLLALILGATNPKR
jgi:hypothetical protein